MSMGKEDKSANIFTLCLRVCFRRNCCFYEEDVALTEMPPITLEATDATLPCVDSVLLRPLEESLFLVT